MQRTLELIFLAADGKTVRITVNDPKEGLDDTTIRNVMNQIITANVFQSTGGAPLTSVKEARITERSVEIFELK